MKFVALHVSVCILVAINGELIIPPGTYSSTKYFDNVLDEVQGAMIDIVAAKSDLLVMEEKLEAITDESLMIFRTESIMEYTVDSDAYENGWTKPYTVTTELTVEGVTESNFDTQKDDLTDAFANSLGVSSSSVKLSLEESSGTSRSASTVVYATVGASEANDAADIASSINDKTFLSTLNVEISKSETLQANGVVINSVSEATVSKRSEIQEEEADEQDSSSQCEQYGGIGAIHEDKVICCKAKCGICTGPGCAQRGLRRSCCGTPIIKRANVCGLDGQMAPCLI